MLEVICRNTDSFMQEMPKVFRKAYGQFFTSMNTAKYMASLFNLPKDKKEIWMLDPGTGSGILCSALLERCGKDLDKDVIIHLVCYENDTKILPLLKKNIESISNEIRQEVKYEIIEENYLLSQKNIFYGGLFDAENERKFDLIIGNPPYKKISKDAAEAKVLSEVCYGTPNLYFLFATMSIHNLKKGGEMVYIIPRSWTSGAYFERFRQYLFKYCVLEHIHLFGSRDKVFDCESVLQETMIIKIKKCNEPPSTVCITTSHDNQDFEKITQVNLPYNDVVSQQKRYVHLATDAKEIETLNAVNSFHATLPELGLKMKTGLVVDFRSRDLLRETCQDDAIPLIYSKHIRDGRVRFPQGKDNEYIIANRSALKQINRNYLFLKRFTAKEEPRRLCCGIYLKRYLPDYKYISSQNKVNFIDGTDEISECVIYGLYVIFNSTLYDTYYRILNGSTQVNSTEINAMPMPEMCQIEEMGRELLYTKNLSEEHCDKILKECVWK